MTLFRDTFVTLVTAEAAAIRSITYLLDGDARDVCSEQFVLFKYDFDGGSAEKSDHVTWPHVVNALLRLFHTDDILRQAQDTVTRTEQSECEDGSQLVKILSKATRLCHHVFSKEELVNHFVQGLLRAVILVAQKVRGMR